jgi:eukaryotic-like serine/threonine-protein kinase
MPEEPNSNVLTDRVGTTVGGKYKLLRVLGAGGMGEVYEAENSWTQKRVALKLMLPELVKNQDLAARFLREARAASKIEHPNVVQVLDMGQDADGSLFIVQEFLKGSDLRRLLDERQALPPREAVELIVPVMSALVAAHRHKIVHRDIKPENVFLVKSAGSLVPKVIDFGIAKMDEGPVSGITKSGAAIGTPWYFSPEAARGERVDAQSDVWAVGIMQYEMLAGRCPWKGETYNALLFEIASAPIPRLEELAPKVPKALADNVPTVVELRARLLMRALGPAPRSARRRRGRRVRGPIK